ncbi:DMP19 family protein [Bradyrhizobium diazoefficiens]
MIEGSRLTTVVVSLDALEAAQAPEKADYLTEAVVYYVNEIQRVGVYKGRELPAVAMQAYHADYYLAQVNNGGHSQFIGNTGGCDAADDIWRCARWTEGYGSGRATPDPAGNDGLGESQYRRGCTAKRLRRARRAARCA